MGLLDKLAEQSIHAGEIAGRGSVAITDFLAKNPGTIPRIERLKEEEEPTLFTHIFGIPTPFLQLGTYLGVEGWKGVALDILTDPTTYLGGWGELTRAGKAGKIARAATGAEKAMEGTKAAGVLEALAKSGVKPMRATEAIGGLAKRSSQLDTFGHQRLQDLLSLADNDVEALNLLKQLEEARPGLTVEKEAGKAAGLKAAQGPKPSILFRGEKIGSASEMMRHFPGSGEMRGIRNAIAKDGLDAGRQVLQEAIDKRKDLQGLLTQFMHAESAQDAMKVAKQIDKLEPNQAFKTIFGKGQRENWKAYFSQAAKAGGAGGVVAPLARTIAEQAGAETPQRALLTVGLPFGEHLGVPRKVIALGTPVMEKVSKIAAKTPYLSHIGKDFAYTGAGTKAIAKAGGFAHVPAFDSVAKLGEAVVDGIKNLPLNAPPEMSDDLFHTYWGRLAYARGVAANMGAEVKYLMGDKADLMRTILDNPKEHIADLSRPISKGNLISQAAKGLSETEIELLSTLQAMHKNVNAALVDHGLLKQAIEDYAPRIGKSAEDVLAELRQVPPSIKGARKSSFMKRGIVTFADALRLNKTETDAGKVWAHWAESAVTTSARADTFARLRFARINGNPLFARAAETITRTSPELYIATKDPAILSLAQASRDGKVFVHKDYVKQVLTAFGGQELTAKAGIPLDGKLANSLLTLNSMLKRASFGVDAVQYGQFTERAASALGRTFLNEPAAQTRRGAWHIARSTDQWDRAVKAGVEMHVLDNDIDPFLNALDQAQLWLKGHVPAVGGLLGAPLRGWRKWSLTVDKPVWEYYHPSLKMTAFSELYDKGLRDPRFLKESADTIAQATAAHVNSAFTGLNWQRLWLGPAGQKWLRLLMIAPDWTASTLKIGADLFANQMARVPFFGKDMVAPTVRAGWARDFAVRGALLGGALAELANLATTSDPVEFLKTGKLNGHFMHENEEDHRTQLALPLTEDGKRLYMKQEKNFQDLLNFSAVWDSKQGPIRFFANRMGFMPTMFYTTLLGRDTFGYPIVSTKDGPMKQIYDRTMNLAGMVLPSPVGTAIGTGAPKPRPIRGALEMAINVGTGRGQEKPEDIDLKREPMPPPDPIPVEFQAAIEEEARSNPDWMRKLDSVPVQGGGGFLEYLASQRR